MPDFSLAGVTGAMVGGYVGWLDYKILVAVLDAAAEKQTQTQGGFGFLQRRKRFLRLLIFGITMAGMPVIGYFAAHQLVS